MRAMHRNANAAPHANAINQAHPGLAESGNAGINGVFFREKRLHRRAISRNGGSAHGAHIATRAKSPPAGTFQQRELHRNIITPTADGSGEAPDHVLIERIQRLWAVHQDRTSRAFTRGNQAGFSGFGHG